MTEHRLKKLFDAQAFFNQPKLAAIINEVTAKPRVLADDDLAFLAAAGEAEDNDAMREDNGDV